MAKCMVDRWDKLNFFDSNMRLYVKRKHAGGLNDKWWISTVNHGGGSVMLRDFYREEKAGDFTEINGIMKKQRTIS